MSTAIVSQWTMGCYFCDAEAPSNGIDMPEGWDMTEVYGRCADGKPGLEPVYVCPEHKNKVADNG